MVSLQAVLLVYIPYIGAKLRLILKENSFSILINNLKFLSILYLRLIHQAMEC